MCSALSVIDFSVALKRQRPLVLLSKNRREADALSALSALSVRGRVGAAVSLYPIVAVKHQLFQIAVAKNTDFLLSAVTDEPKKARMLCFSVPKRKHVMLVIAKPNDR